MEGFTGLCLGFFWGCIFMEIIDWIKKKDVLNQSNQTDSLEETLLTKKDEDKEE